MSLSLFLTQLHSAHGHIYLKPSHYPIFSPCIKNVNPLSSLPFSTDEPLSFPSLFKKFLASSKHLMLAASPGFVKLVSSLNGYLVFWFYFYPFTVHLFLTTLSPRKTSKKFNQVFLFQIHSIEKFSKHSISILLHLIP